MLSTPARLRTDPQLSPILGKEAAVTVSTFQRTFGRAPEVLAFAPGRIEFIGNHTDYNGGPVLGASIDRRAWVGLAARTDGRRRFATDAQGKGVQLEDLTFGHPERQQGRAAWTNYPLGVLAALPAFNLRSPGGFDFLVHSTLPMGAGLSSSAAIEMASALAFLHATNQDHSRELIVQLGLHAENNFVGVPCGLLDQGVSAFGQKDHLVLVDTLKPEFRLVPLPQEIHLWIFNTHAKHELADGAYAARHQECMQAAAALGVGHLADATIAQLERTFPEIFEPVVRRAQHVIGEVGRVHAVMAALVKSDFAHVGRLLTASHRSSQYFFENSTRELDFLVDRLVKTPDVHGARLTGGGFGGAVFAMTTAQFTAETAGQVASAYETVFQNSPTILKLKTGEGARLWQQT